MFLLYSDFCWGDGLLQKISSLRRGWWGNVDFNFNVFLFLHGFSPFHFDVDIDIDFRFFEERRDSPPGDRSDVKSLDEVVMFVVSVVVVVVEHLFDVGTLWDVPSEELFHFLFLFLPFLFEGLVSQ